MILRKKTDMLRVRKVASENTKAREAARPCAGTNTTFTTEASVSPYNREPAKMP